MTTAPGLTWGSGGWQERGIGADSSRGRSSQCMPSGFFSVQRDLSDSDALKPCVLTACSCGSAMALHFATESETDGNVFDATNLGARARAGGA